MERITMMKAAHGPRPPKGEDPRWPTPTSVEEARIRADACWQAIQRIDLQLADETRARKMTGDEYQSWKFRASHARVIRQSELRFLRQYLAAHGWEYARGRNRQIVAAAHKVVELYKEGNRGQLLDEAVRELSQALQLPEEQEGTLGPLTHESQ
jgi:hypothetical protein